MRLFFFPFLLPTLLLAAPFATQAIASTEAPQLDQILMQTLGVETEPVGVSRSPAVLPDVVVDEETSERAAADDLSNAKRDEALRLRPDHSPVFSEESED